MKTRVKAIFQARFEQLISKPTGTGGTGTGGTGVVSGAGGTAGQTLGVLKKQAQQSGTGPNIEKTWQ